MPQIQVWINKDSDANVEKLVKTLNQAGVAKKAKKLKVFFIFVDKTGTAIEPHLTALANKENAQDLALAYLAPDHEAVTDYKINLQPQVRNTVMLYRNRMITWKRVNVQAKDADLADLTKAIDELTQ